MGLEVRFHPAATAQLFELYEYIVSEAGRLRAGGYIGRIESACLRLGRFPEMGRAAKELGAGLRAYPLERRAMIIYRVAADAVEVLGVYHGGQDLAALARDGWPE